jgi:GNAT superfamily N-acetyltransferase
MQELASYSATESLRDGRPFEVRALRPEDRDGLVAAVGQISAQSIYRRFLTARRKFSDQEVSSAVNVDFVNHVALVAVVEENGASAIVGGGRYIVVNPGKAEVAFVVIDKYQGLGIGTKLMRHLTAIARRAGLREFIADVLADNKEMLKVFGKSGLSTTASLESGVVHVMLRLC